MDFRCFASLDLCVPEAGVVLTGANAQGKTSILEAICLLVRLHSPRTHRMASMVRFGADGFGVAGDPWGSERQVRQGSSGMQLRVDGDRRASPREYLADGGLVVWMGNDDLELVRGPGEVRRRFLDFLGSQVSAEYRVAWSKYRRAVKAKNLLLKSATPRTAELASYEAVMAEHGAVLMAVRQRLVAALAPHAAAAQMAVSGRHEPLTVTYRPAAGEDLLASMWQAREKEQRMRQAVVGPHRDDLELRLHGMAAAEFASEGQQRTLALAMKLAQGEVLRESTTVVPTYLLDDIFGELDPPRRRALLANLPTGAQKWITTTHLGWLDDTPLPSGFLHCQVRDGACGLA